MMCLGFVLGSLGPRFAIEAIEAIVVYIDVFRRLSSLEAPREWKCQASGLRALGWREARDMIFGSGVCRILWASADGKRLPEHYRNYRGIMSSPAAT